LKKKPKGLQGKALRQSDYYGKKMNADLQKSISIMTKEVKKEIEKLFSTEKAENYFENSTGMDATITNEAKILLENMRRKFGDIFGIRSGKLALHIMTGINKASGTKLNSSLKSISKELAIDPEKVTEPIKEVFEASVQENVLLIKTIPEAYFDQIQGQVMRAITTGNGLQDLIPFFAKQEGITKRHARNMALDQTRKAYNSINKARMQSAGIEKFKWVHSGGGQKPRKYHMDAFPTGLNGGIFSFDDLPVIDKNTGERGIPAQAINCRCVMVPVIDLED